MSPINTLAYQLVQRDTSKSTQLIIVSPIHALPTAPPAILQTKLAPLAVQGIYMKELA